MCKIYVRMFFITNGEFASKSIRASECISHLRRRWCAKLYIKRGLCIIVILSQFRGVLIRADETFDFGEY